MLHHSFLIGQMFHALFCLLFAIGLVFLIVWAAKTLPVTKLKLWGIGFLIVGIVGAILTVLFCFVGQGRRPEGMMPMKGMMLKEGQMMEGHMNMGATSMMLEGKSGPEFDQAFIKMMIPHHEDAIMMAKMALESADHQEIKDLATEIIAAQQREIDEMKEWMKNWGY